MKFHVRLLFGAAVVATFVGVGVAALVLVNLAPAILFGNEVLVVSPYFTILPSLVAAPLAALYASIGVARWFRGGETGLRGRLRRLQFLYSFLVIFGVAFAAYVARHGLYPEQLDIQWREELRLANGSPVDVDRRMEYKRVGFRLKKYDAYLQFNELRFLPAADESEVYVRTKVVPTYLNQIDGKWYLVVAGRDAGHGENWGQNYNTMGQRLAVLDHGSFRPIDWQQAPDVIVISNLVSTSEMSLEAIDTLPARKLSLNEKRKRMREYALRPKGPDPLRITRHHSEKKHMVTEYKAALKSLEWD